MGFRHSFLSSNSDFQLEKTANIPKSNHKTNMLICKLQQVEKAVVTLTHTYHLRNFSPLMLSCLYSLASRGPRVPHKSDIPRIAYVQKP